MTFTFKVLTDFKDKRPVYLVGTFNGWRVEDEAYRMQKVGEGHYQLSCNFVNASEVIEYKYTRGNWANVEVDRFGHRIPNRQAMLSLKETKDFVPKWRVHDMSFHSMYLPQIKVVDAAFDIPQLNKKRRVCILLPYHYDYTNQKFPVLYLQDGQNLFDKNAPYGNWEIDRSLATLAEEGLGDVIVVTVDHGESERVNEFTPRENIGLDIGHNEGTKYLDFMANTLKPYIDQNYRTKLESRYTGFGGSSMGGLISVYAGLLHSETFGKLMVFSPALWIYPSIYQDAEDFKATKPIQVYGYGGGKESKKMVPNFERLQGAFISNNPVVQFDLRIEPNGEHNEARWRKEFGRAVMVLFNG